MLRISLADHAERWANMKQIVVGLFVATMANTVSATSFYVPMTIYSFKLSRVEQHTLERIACRPFNVKMLYSQGIDSDGDRRKFDAVVRCASHGVIYEQKVFFERDCVYEESWMCETEKEILLARFSDRKVKITAQGISLAEAYRIVSYFVSNRLIEPIKAHDYFQEPKGPFDVCHVSAQNGDELELKCRSDQRWVERIRSGGMLRYRQIPLPWCATKDNDACVYGP
jgi:hypothetical protein